ncbi:predicted protein [Nematostella vectensis]|uniref:Uncharacterized protein n=1 Tax=Nematostella vectensis TaxID=45351 RepID=A7RLD0_NEMVE|nr:predicted protein [Nematostella vectensis]|eukprot:XP_001639644.1 predicted protein [Nematostella vectensis]
MYGGPQENLTSRRCDERQYKAICAFSAVNCSTLRCDWSICRGNEVYLGVMSNSLGVVMWRLVRPLTESVVMGFMKKTRRQGHEFCFIKCGLIMQVVVHKPKVRWWYTSRRSGEGGHIKCGLIIQVVVHKPKVRWWYTSRRSGEESYQVWSDYAGNANQAEGQVMLIKPKVRMSRKTRNPGVPMSMNINIVLLDSIARPHFYRVMRKSVSALRDVVYRESVNATVLDFEMFQAVGQHTFENLRPLFSGRTANHSADSLGIQVLFSHFFERGYQTLFQEDLCWFDEWGTHLTNLRSRPDMPRTSAAYRKRWRAFQELVNTYNIDNYGLTHFSCEVLNQYGYTNPYDRPGKICLNGRFISSYFLQYIKSILSRIRSNKKALPLLSYLHLNTGHNDWGTRIRNVDSALARFISTMSRDDGTLSIIMSDHGHTRTPYARTSEGMRELYNPFLFMIVPHGVAAALGKSVVAALVQNQRRLFTTLDLHHMLKSIHGNSKPHKPAGLLALLPSNRTCADLPIMPLAQCRCEVAIESFEDGSPKHVWLAEFALGWLNNLIHKQYVSEKKPGPSSFGMLGYGRCSHLIGQSFTNVRERHSGNYVYASIDIHVSTEHARNGIFQVALKRTTNGESLELVSWNRHSLYNPFKTCKDRQVDVQLCICNTKKLNNTNSARALNTLIPKTVFGVAPVLETLYSNCLFLVRRDHCGISTAYELANSCHGRSFMVDVSGSSLDDVIVSRGLPFVSTVQYRTVSFLFSVIRKVYDGRSFQPRIVVTVL